MMATRDVSSATLILALTLSALCGATAGAGSRGEQQQQQQQHGDNKARKAFLRVKVLDKPSTSTTNVPLHVTARVTGGGVDDGANRFQRLFNPNGGGTSELNVLLRYRAMFGEEKSLAMNVVREEEEGHGGDSSSSSSSWSELYAASIPAEDLPGYGKMIRYWITAEYTGGGGGHNLYARKPRREEDFYGAVVDAAAVASESPLSTLHWFVEDTYGAMWDNPVETFVAFDPAGPAGGGGGGGGGGEGLRFYGGGVTVRRRGSGRRDSKNMWGKSGSKDWPKRKFKLDFRGRDFKVNWGGGGGGGVSNVEEINLHSSYDEPGPESYLREVLAASVFERAGVPAPAAKHVVLRQNGNFYGLYVMVENVDDSFLERQGMDPNGPLFKAVHWKYSNLRPAAPSWAPCAYAPDWETSWGPCPEVYRYSGRGDEEWNAKRDLGVLLESLDVINRGGGSGSGGTARLWNSVDVNAVVKEMAAQTVMLHQDRCAKNYYVYKSPPGSGGKWTRVPWDMEDAFATDYRDGEGRCDAGGAAACRTNSDTYCVQSCEWWNSPFFCDSNHPQDVFHEADGRSTWNHLVNAVLVDGGARTDYLRQVKNLLNDLHYSGWLETEARTIADRIRGDARRDAEAWGRGDMDRGLEALVTQMRDRRSILTDNYGAYWKNL